MVQRYQGRISLSEKKVREKLLIFCKNISIPDFRSFLADRMRDASDDEGEKESTPTRTSGGRDRDYDTTSSRPSHPDRQPYRPGQMMEAGGGRGGRGVAPFAGGTRGLTGTAGGTATSSLKASFFSELKAMQHSAKCSHLEKSNIVQSTR